MYRTKKAPTIAGEYWWRSGKGQNAITIRVWLKDGVLGYYSAGCFDYEFTTSLERGEWSNIPIALPSDLLES